MNRRDENKNKPAMRAEQGLDQAMDEKAGGQPRVDVLALMAGHREIVLVYKDTEYRLRLTSNDKLLLTK